MRASAVSPLDPTITRIVIQRNQSLSWQGLGGFLVANLILYLVFAVGAAVAGWWPVVGFVLGAFLALVGTVLGLTLSQGREVITVCAHTVVVEYGRHRAESRTEMDRYWARVERIESPRPALLLRSRGGAVEIGRALGDTDRKALARRLRELVGPGAVPGTDEWYGRRSVDMA